MGDVGRPVARGLTLGLLPPRRPDIEAPPPLETDAPPPPLSLVPPPGRDRPEANAARAADARRRGVDSLVINDLSGVSGLFPVRGGLGGARR